MDKQTYDRRWAGMMESWHGDPGFRSRMEDDPKTALAEHGFEISGDRDVRVSVNSEDVIHVVVPPDPNRMVTDDDLDGVAGGIAGYGTWADRMIQEMQMQQVRNARDSGQCFLTTAVAGLRGEADDGPTLTALRGFRDGYMSETEERRGMVAAYYAAAPAIVAAIPAGHADWDWIGERIDAAVAAIGDGDGDAAFDVYAGMVERLTSRWLG